MVNDYPTYTRGEPVKCRRVWNIRLTCDGGNKGENLT